MLALRRLHSTCLLGVYVSSGGISGLKFILLPDACSPEVSADFGFGDSPASNVWDCWNDLVLFEFSGETFDMLLSLCAPHCCTLSWVRPWCTQLSPFRSTAM